MYCTAPTGIAASHIDGMTLHSFAGWVVSNHTPSIKQTIFNLSKNKRAREQLQNCQVLIIDGKTDYSMELRCRDFDAEWSII